MSTELTWQAAALRLALTVAAGALIGLNRGERGRAAGLRTVILVSVAACLAMLQVNALLSLAGKSPTSFITLDLMRLPLGILSGMGFIGAGAILRRGSLVMGVTTAATLWLMTVVGLCFGGGQLALGGVGTAVAAVVLWLLRAVESRLPRDRHATLVVTSTKPDGLDALVRATLSEAKLETRYQAGVMCGADAQAPNEVRYRVSWRGRPIIEEPSRVLGQLAAHPGVQSVRWDMDPADLDEP